jgi:hypothetical protein
MGFMGTLTALLYAALAVYLGGWFQDRWIGDFSLLLFLLTLVTFAYWLAERLYFQPRREAAAAALEQQDAARRADLARQGISQVDGDLAEAKGRLLMQPWWLDWTAGLFPVILIVFLLRSFLFEPFKIPSGSMLPTLESGDLILVQKFSYGVRLPVVDKKVLATGEPARGDVVVFRYPPDPRIDYIKRVVGLAEQEADDQRQGDRRRGIARLLRRGRAPLHPAVARKPRRRRASHPAALRPPALRARRRTIPQPRRLQLQCGGCDLQGARRPLLRDGRQP